MALWIIEINDTALSVWQDGMLAHTSPSIALVEPRHVVTGSAAEARRHREPGLVHDRFWQQLNELPLAGATRRCRHHADLAYHHLHAVLEAVGRPREAVLAVPADYDGERLALLLGIAGALDLVVGGLVDAGTAALAAVAPAGSYTVATLYRHYATLADYVVGEQVERTAVRVCEPASRARIEAAWADLVADAFLDQARFDPLHAGASEQALHDALPGWLATADGATEIELNLPLGGGNVGARLDPRELARVPAMVLAPLAEQLDPARQLVLEAGLAGMPGIAALFGGAPLLSADAVARGIADRRLALGAGNAGGISFTTRLPAATAPGLAVVAMRDNAAVTHLVAATGHARAIGPPPLGLGGNGRFVTAADAVALVSRAGGEAVASACRDGVLVNGTALTTPRALAAGDRVSLPGAAEFLAIRVD
ncbi:MAG: hypothetical protein AB7Q81_02865 [Gammaproteobacteria bacterium]